MSLLLKSEHFQQKKLALRNEVLVGDARYPRCKVKSLVYGQVGVSEARLGIAKLVEVRELLVSDQRIMVGKRSRTSEAGPEFLTPLE